MRWILLILVAALIVYFLLHSRQESAYTPGQTTPSAAATASPDRRAMLETAARAVGVQLLQFEPTADGAVVTISWSSDRTDMTGEFLQQAQRDGAISDFDLTPHLQESMIDGRRTFTSQASVKF